MYSGDICHKDIFGGVSVAVVWVCCAVLVWAVKTFLHANVTTIVDTLGARFGGKVFAAPKDSGGASPRSGSLELLFKSCEGKMAASSVAGLGASGPELWYGDKFKRQKEPEHKVVQFFLGALCVP